MTPEPGEEKGRARNVLKVQSCVLKNELRGARKNTQFLGGSRSPEARGVNLVRYARWGRINDQPKVESGSEKKSEGPLRCTKWGRRDIKERHREWRNHGEGTREQNVLKNRVKRRAKIFTWWWRQVSMRRREGEEKEKFAVKVRLA